MTLLLHKVNMVGRYKEVKIWILPRVVKTSSLKLTHADIMKQLKGARSVVKLIMSDQ